MPSEANDLPYGEWLWAAATTSGRAWWMAEWMTNAARFTGWLPYTTSPSWLTRIRSLTRMWRKLRPNGLTQKWSGNSGSRTVMWPATPSPNPKRPKMRSAPASFCLRCSRAPPPRCRTSGARPAAPPSASGRSVDRPRRRRRLGFAVPGREVVEECHAARLFLRRSVLRMSPDRATFEATERRLSDDGSVNRAVMPPSIAPPAANYAHAVLSEAPARLLHAAGVVPVTADGSVPADLTEQAAVVWANIGAILAEAAMGVSDVVSITTYVVAGGAWSGDGGPRPRPGRPRRRLDARDGSRPRPTRVARRGRRHRCVLTVLSFRCRSIGRHLKDRSGHRRIPRSTGSVSPAWSARNGASSVADTA